MFFIGVIVVVQELKDSSLSLQWLGSLLRLRFTPWPGTGFDIVTVVA